MVLVVRLLGYLLTALQIAIIARALFSWIDPVGRTPVGAFLHRITNPILNPIRRVMPSTGFVDLSPIIALVLITVIKQFLPRLLGV